ncbi:MAG: VPS10 domain-containing protein, partial [Vicinamibacterales bacterium]
AYDDYRSLAQSSPYRAIPWQHLGPTNISGRATDVEVAGSGSARRIYAAFATSGVWATDDNGATWRPIFDDQPTTSIGDIAVSPPNPNILWVGTGEANLFRASMPGVGIFKSTDAGRTFTHAGLTDSQTIARIVAHPTDPEIVYVAASGHGWTENAMRGVFKTTDGGRTWSKVLSKSPQTGAIDLVMDPAEANTLYAATWQRTRRKWSDPRVEPGYDESGIWKTTDGGKTWADASQGLPAPAFRGRIGLDVARSNPNVLYAFLDNYEPGRPAKEGERDAYSRPIMEARIKAAEVYRTDDKGATWRKVTENSELMTNHSGTYGWVFGQIRVDPTDENTFYTLGIGLHVSRNAGKTFSTVRGTHGDHHGLWIDPQKPTRLYSANDGGFYISEDAGKSWDYATSAGGVQFYNVVLDGNTPAWAYGSIQDDGSRRGRVNLTADRDRIPAVAWVNAPGGEGSHHAIDPANVNIIYSHGFYGNFTRTDVSGVAAGRGSPATPAATSGDADTPAGRPRAQPEQTAGQKAAPARRRGEGQPAPQSASQQRGQRGQGGRGRRRAAGTPIRPRVADGDPELRAQWMAPIIASVHQPGVIYAGYQFVYRSGDRGDSWNRISPDLSSNDPTQMLLKSSSAVPYQTITALAESPPRKGLLYAGTDDGKLHVTQDDGKTWTDLSSHVPTLRWYSRVVPSRHAAGTVYVTQRGREDDDFGVYVYKSTDFGKTFTSLAANIPAGSVNVIREDPSNPNVLYLGTDFGAFISTTGGQQWQVLGGGLPSVQVSDLAYHARDNVIVIATYGRGMYALDALRLKE